MSPITGAPPDVPVSVRVYRAVGQDIPDSIWTVMIFTSQRWDDPNDDQWVVAPNPTRLTCRVDGPYVITGHVRWDAGNGDRFVDILLNGTTIIGRAQAEVTASDFVYSMALTTQYKMVVGDFVELLVWQNTGGVLGIGSVPEYTPEFMMMRCV